VAKKKLHAQPPDDTVRSYGRIFTMGRPRDELLALPFVFATCAWAPLASAQTETVLYSFADQSDGAIPQYGLINVGGVLYGVTTGTPYTGGDIFSLTLAGQETVLASFGPYNDLTGGLTNIGNMLYGVTTNELYAVSLTGGAPTGLVSFTATKGVTYGQDALGTLLVSGGELYGATSAGGETKGYGTIYRTTVAGKASVLYRFTQDRPPVGGLVRLGSKAYGFGNQGGAGTIYSITSGGVYSLLYTFTCTTSDTCPIPVGSPVSVGGVIYGMSFRGGTYNQGTIFSITTAGVAQTLHSFGADGDGATPYDGLTSANGLLYGTTYSGGAYNSGTVFTSDVNGNVHILHSFRINSADGAFPVGRPLVVGATVYGTTLVGGANGYGTVYVVTP
jgi:uncharacterized repeat protein (TIGR03803 family)